MPDPAEFPAGERPVDAHLARFEGAHRHPVNRLLHGLCVPAMLWALVALLWLVPVPAMLGRTGFWAGMALAGGLIGYLGLSRALALALAPAFAAIAFLTHWLHATLGPEVLFWSAILVLALASLGIVAGHALERRRPSLRDLATTPLWLASRLLKRFGVSY